MNAMAEAFNSLYKWELIYPQGPWKGLDDVEFATLGYIDWFNHRRLHGEITDNNTYLTPAEFEALYYRQDQAAAEATTHPIDRAVIKPGRFILPPSRRSGRPLSAPGAALLGRVGAGRAIDAPPGTPVLPLVPEFSNAGGLARGAQTLTAEPSPGLCGTGETVDRES
jgi:hypothetical protein